MRKRTKPHLIKNNMKTPDLGIGGLLSFWNSMTEKQRTELVKNLSEFHALLGSLKARGIIEVDKNITNIVIKEKTEQTERLKELHKIINAPGIKITEATKKKPHPRG